MPKFPRRAFLGASAVASSLFARALRAASASDVPAGLPKVISSANGLKAVERVMERLRAGDDVLEAAIAGVNLVEDDPNDHSVGYGGLPNERGVVELDCAVMHGPTARAGAVAALRNIRNPSKVARLVMQRTDHVLLVGAGALEFARAHGFPEENLLTDEARKIWLDWKERLSPDDDWLPGPEKPKSAGLIRPERLTGTIHLSAIDAHGAVGGLTSTSGLAFKLPGRVGDSPILGAGVYVDNDVGAAGSTGRGEANLLTCASFFIVEQMRQGKSPTDACLEACRRVAAKTKERRLLDDAGRPNFDVKYYAIDKQGRAGSAALYAGAQFALHDGQQSQLLDSAYLFDAKPSGKN